MGPLMHSDCEWGGQNPHPVVAEHAVCGGLVEEVCVEVEDGLPAASGACQLQHKVQLANAGDGLHVCVHGMLSSELLHCKPNSQCNVSPMPCSAQGA